MKPTKQLFYKTVRSDGRSVLAVPPFERVYEVGGTYRFKKEHPAHGFLARENWNIDDIYNYRKEYDQGNRVLICYGYGYPVYGAPVYPSWEVNSRSSLWAYSSSIFAATYFIVIGELIPPGNSYQAPKPRERMRKHLVDEYKQYCQTWYNRTFPQPLSPPNVG